MPHQCTTCGRTFADGSKEMLSGCPDCGGNKFQFNPASPRTPTSESTADDSAGRTTESDPKTESDSKTKSDPAADSDSTPSVHADWPSVGAGDEQTDTPSPSEPSPSQSRPSSSSSSASSASSSSASSSSPNQDAVDHDDHDAEVERQGDDVRPPAEDLAQASARTDIVSPDELADAASDARRAPDEVDGRVIEPESEDRPGLDELREELNSQFESIKIVSPGQYELNLMELYDRQEYIISLQEDGRYVIEVPGSWGNRDED